MFSRHSLASALAACLVLFCLSASAEAEILARYEFGTLGQETTAETGPAYNPTSAFGGVNATPITEPGTIAIEISSAATAPLSAPFLRVDPQGNSSDAITAVANNKYFQFTLSPSGDAQLDLTSLTFEVARGGGGTPRGYVVRSSFDNFASNLASADVATVRPVFTPVSLDLSPFPATAAPITFRIYAYSPNGGASVDFDNVTVNGSVIPEPSCLGLLALAGTALAVRRRR